MFSEPGKRDIMKFRTPLIIAVLLFLSTSARAAEVLELNDSRGNYDLAPHTRVLEDPSGKLAPEEVMTRIMETRTEVSRSRAINKGYSESAWWIAFSLKNESPTREEWYLELSFPTMDYFELHRASPEGCLLLARQGDSFPFNRRLIDFNNYVVPLVIEEGQKADYLMRIKTTSEVIVPLEVWSREAFFVHSNNEYGALWFYYGVMAVMVLYNLFLFLTIRDTSYLYYVLYVLFVALANMSFNGIAYQVLWPGSPWFHNISIVLTGNLAAITFLQFTRKFLITGKYAPVYDRVIAGFMLLIVPIIIAIPFAELSFSIIALNTMVLVTVVMAMAACVISLKNGYRPAYFYLAAMISGFLGIILMSLRNFGILPDVFLTRYGFHLGTGIDVVLLSFALGYRYNLLKSENEKLLIMSNEIEIAGKIYRSILQGKVPRVKGMAIETAVKPTELIGGDFLEVSSGREGTAGIFLADVSGHGVAASIGAAMLKVAFANNQHLLESPPDLLMEIENTMAGKMGKQHFTATYTFIDTGRKVMRHCNAGHFSTLVLRGRDGPVKELRPRGRAIGLMPNYSFGMEEVKLASGDRIVFYTDGVIESINSSGEIFGETRLRELVNGLRHMMVDNAKDEIVAVLQKWISPERTFSDDFTLVIIEIT